MKFLSFLQHSSRWLDRLVCFTVIGLLVCMVVTTSAGVFWRYVLNSALSWSEELGRFLLVWISFLGAAMATRLWLGRAVDLMIIAFMSVVLVGGIKILPFVTFRIAPTLGVHMDIPYLVMPISAGIIIFHVLVRLLAGAGKQEGAA